MADVHEVHVDKRRSRAGPIIGLSIVILLLIGIVVAMIMNVHGSISWPAGELKFGFWPQTTAQIQFANNATVAIPPEIAASEADIQQGDDAPQDAQANEAQQPAPPSESNTTTPAETEPAPAQ
jgi:hypothetical protein